MIDTDKTYKRLILFLNINNSVANHFKEFRVLSIEGYFRIVKKHIEEYKNGELPKTEK
jgi:hypothetical protein